MCCVNSSTLCVIWVYCLIFKISVIEKWEMRRTETFFFTYNRLKVFFYPCITVLSFVSKQFDVLYTVTICSQTHAQFFVKMRLSHFLYLFLSYHIIGLGIDQTPAGSPLDKQFHLSTSASSLLFTKHWCTRGPPPPPLTHHNRPLLFTKHW